MNNRAGKSWPMEELLRAVKVCQPDWEARRRITFDARAIEKPMWQSWRETVFLPILSTIESARDAACRGALKDLLACDQALDGLLRPDLARASRQAGKALVENFGCPNGERMWLRYGESLKEGKASGHYLAVLAVRSAAFHVAPANFLGAYLFLEACGGWKNYDASRCVEMMEDCLAARSASHAPVLRAA